MLGPVAIVGAGARALGLAEELGSSGQFAGVSVYGRRREVPAHTVFARGHADYVFGLEPLHADTLAVFIGVADEGVPEIAFSVAGQGEAPPGCAAFHLSPVLPTEALAPLHAQGYALGAFHPLDGFHAPDATHVVDPSAERRPGAPESPVGPRGSAMDVRGGFVAVTGSPAAVAVARRIAGALDARVLEVPAGRRPLVDAATTMAGAYLDPLIGLSVRLMERAGIAAADATPALVSVARRALARIEHGDVTGSPSNPVLAGDAERLALHLRALDAEEQRVYALFARELLRIEAEGLDPQTREAVQKLLDRYAGFEPSGIG
jgi:predicted short-subunit dehydrogenase-like oxidoreductase (DUF2520 family)